MPGSGRKLAGIALIVALIVLWAALVASFSGVVGEWPVLGQALFYLVAGIVWIAFHVALMFLAARLLRAPLFYVATGSMANIGGAASAPIVAGVYLPAMAPVGLLLAIAGYILGIYFGLVCAWLLGVVAT